MMKVFLLCASLVVLATAEPKGRSRRGLNDLFYVPRAAPGIAALFPDINPTTANAISEALIAAGLDLPTLQKPVTEVDPETVWTGAETVIRTMLASVPAGCADAMAVHSLADFARHRILEVIAKDILHTVAECTEVARLNGAMAQGTRGVAPTPEQSQAVVNQVKTAVNGKLVSWISATGARCPVDYFDDILRKVDLLAVKDAPVATILAKVAAMQNTFIGIFSGAPSRCAITSSIAELAPHMTELHTFLTTDVIALINNADLPAAAKPILTKKLTETLGMVAADLEVLIQTYRADNVAGYIKSSHSILKTPTEC